MRKETKGSVSSHSVGDKLFLALVYFGLSSASHVS